MRIFSAGLITETNTFSPLPTSLDDFQVQRENHTLPPGADSPRLDLCSSWHEKAKARGDALVVSLMAFAQPAGMTVRAAYEALRDEILSDLQKTMPIDVVLLMLHGAMVAEGYDDCEEDILRRIRAIVGNEVIVGAEFDLHCHLSEAKIASADIVLTYREYPHTDIQLRAEQLFDLAIAAKLGKVRPTMALFDCQMIGMYPTTRQPLRGLVDAMVQAEERPGVLSVSFAHGFQFADVPHVGAKILVATDNDLVLAGQVAREFGLMIYEHRREIGFESMSLPLDRAMAKALVSERLPVVVADQSDNVGGGAPGDSTFALRWILDHDGSDVALAIIYDPEVVTSAQKAGKGATLTVRLGGKMGPSSGDPMELQVTVLAIRLGYTHAFRQQSGEPWLFQAGDVVALRQGNVDMVVSSKRCQCFAPSIFSDLGIDPTRKRLLIVKSYQHFYGAFAPIAGEVIYMAAPGAVSPDPRRIQYRRVQTSNLYPWAPDPLGMDP